MRDRIDWFQLLMFLSEDPTLLYQTSRGRDATLLWLNIHTTVSDIKVRWLFICTIVEICKLATEVYHDCDTLTSCTTTLPMDVHTVILLQLTIPNV